MRRIFIVGSLAVVVSAAGCVRSRPPSPKVLDASTQPEPSAPVEGEQEQEQLNQQIVAAIQNGHYADAIQMARRSRVSQAEAHFAVGELILQGWADPDAVQRPGETIKDGMALMEASARAGHQPAISGLAAVFYTGLRGGATNAVLIAPDTRLNACWEAAKANAERVASCIAMRAR